MERKVCFILEEAGNGGGVGVCEIPGEGRLVSKGPLHCQSVSGQELLKGSFTGVGRGLYVGTAQSALTVFLELVVSGLIRIILIVFSTDSLQFQGWFVPVSLVPVLRFMAANVMARVWSSCR